MPLRLPEMLLALPTPGARLTKAFVVIPVLARTPVRLIELAMPLRLPAMLLASAAPCVRTPAALVWVPVLTRLTGTWALAAPCV